MRGLALGVSITLAAAGSAAAQDLSGQHLLQDVVFAQPAAAKEWPLRLKLSAKHFDIGLAPHLTVGGASRAEAGAELRLGLSRDQVVTDRLQELGVSDGLRFGEKGRWYLFASASGRSVGLNMLRSEEGWSQAGWTTDPTSALIGDAQAGLAWRKGQMQASFGYLHREIKIRHALLGDDGKNDSLVAFSLSIKPPN
jgi:hypothetical protein